ncbi:uncharacterized protein K460DRAFT_371734 [Cucurbitaria berberidis CBS 394.84]|uniref:SH3 domain-containing protein n=1 Tax=Cucurbitaria berberidis CBS 394.84 TaxID=1168544 RepID=A0A9P4G7V8_9PLEO|nr:uncharacterized protein K460DRAFT_371734 [Cucurbitaria berberidis CBS 394.84]KAF1840536.1 hypothetical protein K460DRAFT_371734 [Cucurbitaria berberidis CBS 394.84]
MPDPAQINRSLGTLRTELEYLAAAGVLSPPQLQSIAAQLPQPNGQPSPYVDPRYVSGANQFNPSLVAQQAQDPNNPAHPDHPKHHDWAKKLGSKFGNAAVYGAGATFGADLVNDVMRKF